MHRALVFIFAVLAAGCSKDSLLVDTSVSSLPADVQLHVGQTVFFPREGYIVTFEKVTEDSRCPIGLKCFWAGDGAAKLKIEDRGGAVSNDTLHTTLDPHSVQFQQLSIRLKSLEPYPVHNEPLDPLKYLVTLEIARAVQDSLETK